MAYVVVRVLEPSSEAIPFAILAIALFGTLGLAILGLSRPPTGAFDVKPEVPSFTAPTDPALTFTTLAQVFLAAALTSDAIGDLRSGESILDQWPALLWTVLTVLAVSSLWRGIGVELRPDGLHNRDTIGTLIVPWDAAPAVQVPADKRTSLSVTYGRPELVRRRGLLVSRSQLSAGNVDRQVAADVIQYYVAHPEHRTAIGFHTEYNRVLREVQRTPPEASANV